MASSEQREKRVCVTGASGFIGSWLVRFLLLRGYHVRGTVQNLEDEHETKHLRSLQGADMRLELFEADLLNYDSLAAAIGKSVGVFHVASPVKLEPLKDPQRELVEPAVQGTLNVLKASHVARVRKIVVTSSRAVMPPSDVDTVVDEDSWTDVEHCKKVGDWYAVSKVLAEKTAWQFAEEAGLNIVVINPGVALGKMLQPRLNASSAVLLKLLQGCSNNQGFVCLGITHVEDVAQAHILIYESPDAKGRHICINEVLHYHNLAKQVSKMYPEYNVHRFEEEDFPKLTNPSKKLISLGFAFTPGEQIIRDTVSSLQDKGFLPTL